MKLVKEYMHINEKFVQDSDPIKDMSIGVSNFFPEICKSILENDKNKIIYKLVYEKHRYIIIILDNLQINKFRHLCYIENINNYIKNIIFKLNYQNIFLGIEARGSFQFYENISLYYKQFLVKTPQILCFINPEIKLKDYYIFIERDIVDKNKIIVDIE